MQLEVGTAQSKGSLMLYERESCLVYAGPACKIVSVDVMDMTVLNTCMQNAWYGKLCDGISALIRLWHMCRGVESVTDAVEHLQTGRSIGKVYVQIATELPTYTESKL